MRECRREEIPASALGLDHHEQVTLCEVLDRVLNKGAVVAGEVTISVADIDLLYLGVQLVLTSIETARQSGLYPKSGISDPSVPVLRG